MRNALLAGAVLFAVGCGKTDVSRQAEYERKFQESMTNVTMVGHSTRSNKEGLFGPERYKIEKVTKLTGNTWLFQSRLQYDGKDLPLPVPVTIEWAGDTPVITLTDATIPGIGTWTARVVLYRDQYAGTWSGKDHGGQIFGKIERGR